jgi:YebC/PmpR family DNA-binding regulatory protein
MPKDTIDRAIARGAGNSEADNLEEIKYEGYGPNGVAILIDAMTDNRNRTVAEVRHAFTKAGGSLGTDGSVAYQFESKGIISISGLSEDDTLELVIDYDIEEIESQGEIVTVICKPDNFLNIKEILEQSNAGIENAEITMLPSNSVELGDEDSEKVIRLIDTLEDLDDVQNVYTNAELSEASVT